MMCSRSGRVERTFTASLCGVLFNVNQEN